MKTSLKARSAFILLAASIFLFAQAVRAEGSSEQVAANTAQGSAASASPLMKAILNKAGEVLDEGGHLIGKVVMTGGMAFDFDKMNVNPKGEVVDPNGNVVGKLVMERTAMPATAAYPSSQGSSSGVAAQSYQQAENASTANNPYAGYQQTAYSPEQRQPGRFSRIMSKLGGLWHRNNAAAVGTTSK